MAADGHRQVIEREDGDTNVGTHGNGYGGLGGDPVCVRDRESISGRII